MARALVLAAFAACVAAAAANYYGYEPKCYNEGEKCMGAEGYAAVPYHPCCKGYTCTKKAYDWGYTCEKEVVKKCYAEGEKCMGAAGYPAVPYLGCCKGYTCTKKAYDWGYMCEKEVVKKCYAEGEKCMGAEGYAAVPYLGCCKGYTCTKKAYDWGYMCEKEVVKATYPPKTTVAAKKCVAKGGQCGTGYEKCCDKLVCIKEKYGYRSVCAATKATTMPPTTTTTMKKCAKVFETCGKGYSEYDCCDDKAECVYQDKKKDYRCEPKPAYYSEYTYPY